MGACFDGFDSARRRREDEVAERHRIEVDVDEHLHAVAALLEQDADFLKQNGVSQETSHHTLRVTHLRSPIINVHFEPQQKAYVVTFMRNATSRSAATPEDCAKAIGELLFIQLEAQ